VSTLSPDGTLEGHDGGRVGQLLAIAREVLSQPDVTADEDLTDRGATSLSIVRIIMEASLNLQLDIDAGDLGGTITVLNLARIATPTPS
jgi:Phosphopantetheine attachment site